MIVQFPSAETIRRQSANNSDRLYEAVAKLFLEEIRIAQLEFDDYAIVNYETGEGESIYTVFHDELDRQYKEVGADKFVGGGIKENYDDYIKNARQGDGGADHICSIKDAIQEELEALGYGVYDLHHPAPERGCAVLVTWEPRFSGKNKLTPEHLNDLFCYRESWKLGLG